MYANRKHHPLKSGETLLISEAEPADARAVLEYLSTIGGESDFLTFGRNELTLTEQEEEKILAGFRDADNRLFLLGRVDDEIVSTLSFSAMDRNRLRHTGSFGMSVRKEWWGMGIGGMVLDTLIAWGRENAVIAKINLQVRTDNQRAIRLYESRGFMIEGTISRCLCVDGIFFDNHHMGLEV